jgi:hypothetical protein
VTQAAVLSDGDPRIHLTELDAAMASPGRRGACLQRNTALDECGRMRLTIKRIRVQLDKTARRKYAANSDWEPDADFCTALEKTVSAAAKAVQTEERLRKLTREDRKGYTDEQLDAVWKANLVRAAQTMTDEEWWSMIAIRFGENVASVMLPSAAAEAA